MLKRQPDSRNAIARSAWRALIASSILCLVPKDALAYIDPGSGMLLIQGVLAFIGGVVVFVKNPLAFCKRLWARVFTKSTHLDR